MKKDVNLIFFGLLLLMLIAMVGVMLYSDYTYHRVNVQYIEFKEMYENAQDELNQSREEVEARDLALQEKERALLDIINELNLSKQKETSLSGHYEQAQSEKERLEDEIDDVEAERNKWKANYDSKSLELGKCQTDYALSQKRISQIESGLLASKSTLADAIKLSEEMREALNDLDCDDVAACNDADYNMTGIVQDLQAKLQSLENYLGTE